MWNKKNEPETRGPVVMDPPRPEPVPMPAGAPAPAPRAEVRQVAAIGSSMSIKGEIRSKEELYVDGDVDGLVELQGRLTVGPHGKIKANVKAREVIIYGSIKGNVEVTDKIAIKEKGSLVGDIKTAGIVIDDGAYFKGSIDIVRPIPIKQQEAQSA